MLPPAMYPPATEREIHQQHQRIYLRLWSFVYAVALQGACFNTLRQSLQWQHSPESSFLHQYKNIKVAIKQQINKVTLQRVSQDKEPPQRDANIYNLLVALCLKYLEKRESGGKGNMLHFWLGSLGLSIVVLGIVLFYLGTSSRYSILLTLFLNIHPHHLHLNSLRRPQRRRYPSQQGKPKKNYLRSPRPIPVGCQINGTNSPSLPVSI